MPMIKMREEVFVKKEKDGYVIQLRVIEGKKKIAIGEVALTPAQTQRLVNKLASLGIVRGGHKKNKEKKIPLYKQGSGYFYRKPWTAIQHLNKKLHGFPFKQPIEDKRSLSSVG